MYACRLRVSWLHFPGRLYSAGDFYFDEFKLVHFADIQYLQDEFLFCRRYLSESHQCHLITDSVYFGRNYTEAETPQKVKTMREEFRKSALSLHQEKRSLQACLGRALGRFSGQIISSETFLSFFRDDYWKNLWTPDELGWWCAQGLSKYGSAVQPLIDSSFTTTRESLLWIFLGAHHWLHPRDNSHDSLVNSDLEANDIYSCCQNCPEGLEKEPVTAMMSSLSRKEKILLLEETVRKAPEYGQCRDLSGNLFNYFVLAADNEEDIDLMFSVLLEQITESPMQYLFEHMIGLAISYYLDENSMQKLPWKLPETKKYTSKLVRRNRELYIALKN
jgi:hypothetical protein